VKLTTAMTFEGLVRALRWKVHDLAEAVEADHVSGAGDRVDAKPVRRAPGPKKEQDDDRRRR